MRNEKLILVRHGHRHDAVGEYWRDIAERPFDTPLSNRGIRQAIAAADLIAEALKNRDKAEVAMLSSPFIRCLQTAEIIAGTLPVYFGVEPGLCERLHPRFIYGDDVSFLSQEEIARHLPHFDEDHKAIVSPYPPESRRQVRVRAQETWKHIRREYAGPWILVGHGFTMKDIGLLYDGSGKLPRCGEVRICDVPCEDDE